MQSSDLIVLILSFVVGWLSTSGQKTQFVRLIDIFMFGPFLIFLGFRNDNVYIRNILFFMGATTIAYNLKNYYKAL